MLLGFRYLYKLLMCHIFFLLFALHFYVLLKIESIGPVNQQINLVSPNPEIINGLFNSSLSVNCFRPSHMSICILL